MAPPLPKRTSFLDHAGMVQEVSEPSSLPLAHSTTIASTSAHTIPTTAKVAAMAKSELAATESLISNSDARQPLPVELQVLAIEIMRVAIIDYCTHRETAFAAIYGTGDMDPSIQSLHLWAASLFSSLDLPSLSPPPPQSMDSVQSQGHHFDRHLMMTALLATIISYIESPKKEASSSDSLISSRMHDPIQMIPELLGFILLLSFVHDNPAFEKQLCYDSRLRAILRGLAFEMMTSLSKEPMDEPTMSKLAALYMCDAERQVALSLCARTFHSTDPSKDPNPDASSRNADSKRKLAIKKWAGIGLATVAGGVLVGVTGGLAAPFIGAGLGTLFTGVGLAGASAAVAGMGTVAGAAIVGSLFGVTGGGLAAYKLNNRLKDIQEFYFTSISEEDKTGALPLSYVIAISGWIRTPADSIEPWLDMAALSPFSSIHTLTFETRHLISLTSAATNFLAQTAVVTTATQAAQFTLLGGLVGAVIWPVGLLQCAWLVDNPWSMALVKSEQAGRLLARDILSSYMAGKRSVILVGFGIGARVIIYCLLELLEMAQHDDTITGCGDLFGIVDSVYIAGTAVAMPLAAWESIRPVVSGRFVNAYSSNDWFLGFLNRMSINLVAGIGPIPSNLFENVDVSDIIDAHRTYNTVMCQVLERMRYEQHPSM
ncbi:hypothetical protein BASA50_004990 [Batrachochytrium salamandrivorans]|uniref:DUF726 domain-containing protein n=1 Tax=Batrachochytrium salamandrivorans TaxID=1357716 RepID=A0ABQ8FE40_9FUNG|nr:hypothetical protein BASA50_004990 [Batrachochytrium salamandrivorans]